MRILGGLSIHLGMELGGTACCLTGQERQLLSVLGRRISCYRWCPVVVGAGSCSCSGVWVSVAS